MIPTAPRKPMLRLDVPLEHGEKSVILSAQQRSGLKLPEWVRHVLLKEVKATITHQ